MLVAEDAFCYNYSRLHVRAPMPSRFAFIPFWRNTINCERYLACTVQYCTYLILHFAFALISVKYSAYWSIRWLG